MGALATAFPNGGTAPVDNVREYFRTETVRRAADVTAFRATDMERAETVYLVSAGAHFRLDELSAAADDGVSVIHDVNGWRYLRAGGGLFSSTLDGFVPASGGGTSKFLRADGTWTAIGSVFVSVLAFIPDAEHAAIANHTSTYDCKADIEAAIASLGAYGGTVFFPPGRFNVSAKITITGNAVRLTGAVRGFGVTGSLLRGTHATVGDILEYSGGAGGGIEDFGVTCANGVTSGTAIQLTNNAFEISLKSLAVRRVYNGIDVSRATETRITEVHIREVLGDFDFNYGGAAAGCYGLTLTSVTTDNPPRTAVYGTRRGNWAGSTAYALNDFAVANGCIYHCTQAGTSAASGGPSGYGSTVYDGDITDGTVKWKFYCRNTLTGFRVDSYGYSARTISCAFLNGAYGVLMQDTQNTGSSAPWWVHSFDLECDHNYYFDVLLNKGEGFFAMGSWIGSCLTGGGVTIGATWSGEIIITGSRIVGNWANGVLINGGVNCDISHNIIGANSQGGSGTYHGITVAANVNEFTIVGNKIGDLHSATEMQGYGVFVLTGTSNNYIIANNRCHNNVTGKVSDNGSGVNKSVTGNI